MKFPSGGRGPQPGGKCPGLSPRIFRHPLGLQGAGGISEISVTVREILTKNRKNVNGPEIETGSGRGPMTSPSGSGPRGPCRV